MFWILTKYKKIWLVVFLIVIIYNIYFVRKISKKFEGQFSNPVEFSDLPASKDLRYSLWKNIYIPPSSSHQNNKLDVTITTQCSVNRLHPVLKILEYWKGPVSVAVFLPGREIESFKRKLVSLIRCNSLAESLLTVHGVLPLANPPFNKYLSLNSETFDCEVQFTEDQDRVNYKFHNLAYPVNLLRNVALASVQTSHVLVLDVDMLPSKSLRNHLIENSLLEKKNIALVIPTFEMKESSLFPQDKRTLLKQWENGDIRPFYEEVCWKCQMHTKYDAWRDTEHEKDDLVYEASWHEFWEPFYIAPKELVIYDERFEQYGFNRISQLCDLYMQDIEFFVLRNAFIIHSGFKTNSKFHSSKDEENKRNKLIYYKFKKELIQKYPQTSRRC